MIHNPFNTTHYEINKVRTSGPEPRHSGGGSIGYDAGRIGAIIQRCSSRSGNKAGGIQRALHCAGNANQLCGNVIYSVCRV